MSKLTVVSNKAFLPRELRPEHGETEEAGFVSGRAHINNDKEIESHLHRESFTIQDGDISIIVTAGDEPGDIKICVQYEGQIAQYDACLTRQNELLQQTAEWLREILGEFGTDWLVDITSTPCPEGDSRLLHLTELAERIEGRNVASVDRTVTPVVTVAHSVRTGE